MPLNGQVLLSDPVSNSFIATRLNDGKPPCDEALAHVARYDGQPWNAWIRAMTTEAGEGDLSGKTFNNQWIIDFFQRMPGLMAPEVRIALINAIDNEQLAARIYVEQSDLTDEEDTILQSKFKNKLPTVEDGLKDGRIVRKKLSL